MANERGGVIFGKVVDCVASALRTQAMCCRSFYESKREGLGFERKQMREGRYRNQSRRRGRSQVK